MPTPDQILEIASAIKRIRARLGVSQKELARRLDVTPVTMNRIENGSGNIETKTLLRIAEALNVDPAELLGSYSTDFLAMWERFKSLPDDRKQKVIDHVQDQLALASMEADPPGPSGGRA